MIGRRLRQAAEAARHPAAEREQQQEAQRAAAELRRYGGGGCEAEMGACILRIEAVLLRGAAASGSSGAGLL